MSVRILIGDVREKLAELPADSVDCVVTSPPYWGLRDYGVDGQIGLERTLGEHLDVMVEVFDLVRRVMKPEATLWLNYGDCYATKPNGRSAADTKTVGSDDRTFRDKPFSTVGPIYGALPGSQEPLNGSGRRGGGNNSSGAIYEPGYVTARGEFKGTQWNGTGHGTRRVDHGGRVVAGGMLKPKDLCMVPNRLAIALQEAGWWVRSEIIWAKPNPMPDSSGKYRPGTAHEKIFLLTKSARCYYDAESVAIECAAATGPRVARQKPEGGSRRANGGTRPDRPMKAVVRRAKDGDAAARNPNSRPHNLSRFEAEKGRVYETRLLRNYEPAPVQVWEIASRAFSDAHFATFPPELAERCIKAGCPAGGVVLDPFGGAGTTGLVADRLQRSAILIELNPEYAKMARRRIESDAGPIARLSRHPEPLRQADFFRGFE